jgi:poly-gamma-glutamate synthase PgsB/CapB
VPFTASIAVCLSLLIGLGLLERCLRDRAWRDLPIRIHVNGTRGKSTVTRLIWAALCKAGIPALAKTTGAAPRLLFPDGSERPLLRRGKPNIREQLRTLLLAKRRGARAVVLECMALGPELQWDSEHSMVHATIGVITNARTDHTEVMGGTSQEIAASLSNTLPTQSVLVTGDRAFADFIKARAADRRTRVVVADAGSPLFQTVTHDLAPAGTESHSHSWLRINQAIALAVTRELGIADDVALSGMLNAPPDPGSARSGIARFGTQALPFWDLTSANDPESFKQTFEAFRAEFDQRAMRPEPPLLIYNHRYDRPHRLLHFAAAVFPITREDRLLITGDRPALLSWRTMLRISGVSHVRFVTTRRLPAVIQKLAASCQGIVFCGNSHGLDVSKILGLEIHG